MTVISLNRRYRNYMVTNVRETICHNCENNCLFILGLGTIPCGDSPVADNL